MENVNKAPSGENGPKIENAKKQTNKRPQHHAENGCKNLSGNPKGRGCVSSVGFFRGEPGLMGGSD